jgi:excisionase family DNA binding protein
MCEPSHAADVIDRAALRILLALAADGAVSNGARLTDKTTATWETLARSVIAPGPVILTVGGPSSFQGPPPERATVTVTEAARLMGLSQGHVRRLCRRGAIRARRFGERMWLIEVDAVTDWRKAA